MNAQRGGDRLGYCGRGGERGEIYEPRRYGRSSVDHRLHRQPGLPDAPRADERDQPIAVDRLAQGRQLSRSADEARRHERHAALRRQAAQPADHADVTSAPQRFNRLIEHLLLEGAQLRAGLGTNALDERAPGASIDGEGIGLSPGIPTRPHQVRPEHLPQRPLRNERLEVHDQHAGIGTQREPASDSPLDAHLSHRLQPVSLVVDRRAINDFTEGSTAPQGKGIVETSQFGCRPGMLRTRHEGFEALDVQDAPAYTQLIGGGTSLDHGASVQHVAEPVHLATQRPETAGSRRVRPDLIEQFLDRHVCTAARGEQRQHALPTLARHGEADVGDDFGRAE